MTLRLPLGVSTSVHCRRETAVSEPGINPYQQGKRTLSVGSPLSTGRVSTDLDMVGSFRAFGARCPRSRRYSRGRTTSRL
jgi:hypothetical protein